MQYPRMDGGDTRRFEVPQLNGGVNLHRPPHRIDDNQLSACRNLWQRGGMLGTRPGLRTPEDDGWAFAEGLSRAGDIIPLPKAEAFFEGRRLVYSAYLTCCGGGSYTLLRVHRVFGPDTAEELPSLRFGTGGLAEDQPTGGLLIPAQQGQLYVFTNTGGIYLQVFGEENWRDMSADGYVPTVLVNGPSAAEPGAAPGSGGVKYESYNRIQPAYAALYTTNGEDSVFFLPKAHTAAALSVGYRDFDGGWHSHDLAKGQTAESRFGDDGLKMYYNPSTGVFRFTRQGESGEEPGAPARSGLSGNLRAKVTPDVVASDFRRLFRMTFCTWFGGDRSGRVGGARLFMSGNPESPNLIYWSEADNPLYFPESNSALVGDAGSAVTAFGQQNDSLVIFKENEIYYAEYEAGRAVQLSDLIDDRVADATTDLARFPLTPLHTRIGCDCPQTLQLCSNRLIWACSNGEVYGLMGADRYTDRSVCLLGGAVRPALAALDADTLRQAFACTLGGQYLLFAGTSVFLLDTLDTAFQGYASRTDDRFTDEGLVWHIWDNPAPQLYGGAQADGGPLLFSRLTHAPAGGTVGAQEFVYAFDPALHRDRTVSLDSAGEAVYTETPVCSSLCTRAFSFGVPERLKLVRRLYCGIRDDAEGEIRITYVVDGEPVEDGYRIPLTGTGKMREFRVCPGTGRLRTFALCLESTAPIAVDGLVMVVTVTGGAKM